MSLAAILDPRQLGMLFVKDKNEPIYELLRKTSRSFAKVIQQLPDDLANAVCIFYLVLRALDTVEDDPLIDRALKIEMLHSFHELSTKPGYSFHGNSDDEPDAHLLEQYYVVIEQLLLLDPETQKIILDICDKMGHGMAEFVEKPVQTTKEYNLYTHYVAGLVGVGLSRLFVQSGLQSTPLDLELANEMGLFLQKTNILKDYLVDIKCKRLFWPRDVWSLYVQPDQDVDTLSLPENLPRALACLNHLCADNLSLLPSCLEYLSCLDNQQVLRFAAIPQVLISKTANGYCVNGLVFQQSSNVSKRA